MPQGQKRSYPVALIALDETDAQECFKRYGVKIVHYQHPNLAIDSDGMEYYILTERTDIDRLRGHMFSRVLTTWRAQYYPDLTELYQAASNRVK